MTFIGFGLVILGTIFWLLGEMSLIFAGLSAVHREYGPMAREYQRSINGQPNLVMPVGSETATRIERRYRDTLEQARAHRAAEQPEGERIAPPTISLRVRPPTVTELMAAGLSEAEAQRRRRGLDAISFEVLDVDVEAGTLQLRRPLAEGVDTDYVVESFEPRNLLVVLQGAIGLVAIPLAIFGLFWVTNRPRIADFLIATEIEMRKVNWPTRKELIGSTWVVIIGALMLAILLRIVDIIFAALFISIGILEGTSPFEGLLF